MRINEIENIKSEEPSAKQILTQNVGERLFWALTYSKEDRELVIETLESWVSELRSDLNPNNAYNIETILRIKKDLEKTNVSLKLALENLVIKAR